MFSCQSDTESGSAVEPFADADVAGLSALAAAGRPGGAKVVGGPWSAIGRRLTGFAWAAIPAILVTIVVLHIVGSPDVHSYSQHMQVLNFVFATLVSLLIVSLAAHGFLVTTRLALLLLACGMLVWGLSGFVAVLAGRGHENTIVTIHNCCAWLAGACHLAGAVLACRSAGSVRRPAIMLGLGLGAAISAVWLLSLAARAGFTPRFFIQHEGGTPLRQSVLGSAIGMFMLTGVLIYFKSVGYARRFVYWYSMAMGLLAVGLLGVMLQSAYDSVLGWVGRATQYLGGVYMLAAVVAAVRQGHGWRRAITVELHHAKRALRAAQTDRGRLLASLRQANERLEQRVAERTAELERRAGQLARLASELTLTEERERRRLALVLHDHLQQILVGAKFALKALAGKAKDSYANGIEEIKGLIDESIRVSRLLTGELSPPVLHEAGLAAGLAWLAQWARDKHGLDVHVRADESANPIREDARVLGFRAAGEMLFNVAKHAGVSAASIELARMDDKHVRLTVTDEGVGFDPSAVWSGPHAVGGLGLLSIRERLALLGGRLDIESSPRRGARLTMVLPG